MKRTGSLVNDLSNGWQGELPAGKMVVKYHYTVHDKRISDKEATNLVNKVQQNQAITHVTLSENEILGDSSSILSNALKENQNVTLLEIKNSKENYFMNLKPLAEALEQNKSVQKLEIKFTNTDAKGFQSLVKAIKSSKTLKEIKISVVSRDNEITKDLIDFWFDFEKEIDITIAGQVLTIDNWQSFSSE